MMSLEALEQDPFDADEFAETLAWRATGNDFNPIALKDAFEKTIRDLKDLKLRTARKVEKLEEECKEEDKAHWQRVSGLQTHNKAAFDHFQGLDERINFVATKVVHLGDQLEGVNNPRTRAAEAHMLMKYYQEFFDPDVPQSTLFTDPFQVQLAADVIQKLYQLAEDLPSGERFDEARDRIMAKYAHIERNLLDEFKQAYEAGDKKKMKRLAGILSNFKGYGKCIDTFIEESQKGAFLRGDIFLDIPPLCEMTYDLIREVFSSPDQIMSKFVHHIYDVRLKQHLQRTLAEESNLEKYLQSLNTLYAKTTDLSRKLAKYKLGSDASFLTKITKNIFQNYLDTYIEKETKFLRDRNASVLHRFYTSKGHQKKNIASGGLNELRRDLQNVLGAKANINLGPTIENYAGETFLSHEVAINILQETKLAFNRCQVLSSREWLAPNASRIFDILLEYLCEQHMAYAVILGLQGIPLADPKSEPEIYFFEVVGQCNTIFHLFEKQFNDYLAPLVSGTHRSSECYQRKRETVETLESKLEVGLDRTLASIIGWIRFTLKSEQKVSDFKPESDDLQMTSQACAKVRRYANTTIGQIREGLDGNNVEAVLREFGVRFHRVIYEHLQGYQYNSMGAMLVICDVNEYRKCVKELHIPVVDTLFDTLHSLCNLLVVVPENLKQVSQGHQLVSLDKSVLLSFVQLRADYKIARLATIFK